MKTFNQLKEGDTIYALLFLFHMMSIHIDIVCIKVNEITKDCDGNVSRIITEGGYYINVDKRVVNQTIIENIYFADQRLFIQKYLDFKNTVKNDTKRMLSFPTSLKVDMMQKFDKTDTVIKNALRSNEPLKYSVSVKLSSNFT